MAKKIKKFTRNIDSPRRGGEKMRRAARGFNRAIICYMLLVAAAVVCGMNGNYDLSNPSLNGFAICFLLLPAYLPLFILGTLGAAFGVPITDACGHEVILLGICDLLLAFSVWWMIRIAAARKQSASLLKNSRTFVLIMVYWGIFQLACCMIQLLWLKSGLNAVHHFTVGH